MAGMLPGVECARRRRLHHQSTRSSDAHGFPAHHYTRHPSICLYASNLESYHSPPLNKERESFMLQKYVDENLDATAKEAKERLDKKFQTNSKFHTRRQNDQEELGVVEGRSVSGSASREMQLDNEFDAKKESHVSLRMLSWTKLVRFSSPYQLRENLCSQKKTVVLNC